MISNSRKLLNSKKIFMKEEREERRERKDG